MSIAHRLRLFIAAALFAVAYVTGMKILLELSIIAPFIVTAVLAAGTAVAVKWVKREARLEGAKPNPVHEDPSLLGILKAMVGAAATAAAVMGGFAFSTAAGVAVIEIIVFGFMIAIALILVFARIEVRTRSELAAKL